jgi:hypothetical protein
MRSIIPYAKRNEQMLASIHFEAKAECLLTVGTEYGLRTISMRRKPRSCNMRLSHMVFGTQKLVGSLFNSLPK